MDEPKVIIKSGTRIQTQHINSESLFVSQKHIDARKSEAIGVITGIVGGHGGDVYWVAHIGDTCMAAYGWWEFELAPVTDPCDACEGTGIDWEASQKMKFCTPCATCHGSAMSAIQQVHES